MSEQQMQDRYDAADAAVKQREDLRVKLARIVVELNDTSEECLAASSELAYMELEDRISAALKVIKDKHASKRLRPSESATLYEIRMHLEGAPFMANTSVTNSHTEKL